MSFGQMIVSRQSPEAPAQRGRQAFVEHRRAFQRRSNALQLDEPADGSHLFLQVEPRRAHTCHRALQAGSLLCETRGYVLHRVAPEAVRSNRAVSVTAGKRKRSV